MSSILAQQLVLKRIVELLRVDLLRGMRSFPFNCTPMCFVDVNALIIAQFLPDATAINHDMLFRVNSPAQRLWQRAMWHAHNASLPACHLANFAHPLFHSKSNWLSDIVDASSRSLIRHCQCNGIRHVLNVAMRPLPLCLKLVEQDRGSPIIHALEEGEGAVLVIMRPVDHRETQNRSGKRRIAQHHTLDQNLVVVIGPFARCILYSRLLSSEGIQIFSQWRIFCNDSRINRASFFFIDTPECLVDILAAERYNAVGHTTKDIHYLSRILLYHGNHIQHHLWRYLLQFGCLISNRATVP